MPDLPDDAIDRTDDIGGGVGDQEDFSEEINDVLGDFDSVPEQPKPESPKETDSQPAGEGAETRPPRKDEPRLTPGAPPIEEASKLGIIGRDDSPETKLGIIGRDDAPESRLGIIGRDDSPQSKEEDSGSSGTDTLPTDGEDVAIIGRDDKGPQPPQAPSEDGEKLDDEEERIELENREEEYYEDHLRDEEKEMRANWKEEKAEEAD